MVGAARSLLRVSSCLSRVGGGSPVLTLLILVLLIVVVFSVLGRASARRRRTLIEEEMRRAPGRDDPTDTGDVVDRSALPLTPFDLLFGPMLGGGVRSYEFDPATGEWVEITDEQPPAEPEPADADAQAASTPASERRRSRSDRRRSRRGSDGASPLAGLLGSGMIGGAGGSGGGDFEVEPPDELVTFADVGGMEKLKREVRDTVGLMIRHPEDAERYGIEWNGILLHGPPGVGKTYFAQAIAGEYGLNFIHVSTGDLVSSLVGGSAQNIEKAFQTALEHLPCLLFFDEFDSVAQRRDQHARPGVAPHGEPAADVAGGEPRRAGAARSGGDELDRAPGSGRRSTGSLRSAHSH
jgi:hypothetical protein